MIPRFLPAVVFILLTAAQAFPETKPLQYGRVPEIQQVKPKKPVNIRLHRNAKGEYSWDLSGDSAEEVMKADARLRKILRSGGPEQ